MNLADELRAIGIRKPIKAGGVRRFYCVDDGTADKIEREKKLQKKREYQRKWAKEHPDRIKAMRARDRQKRREAILKYKAEWRKKNIVHVRAYQARKQREWRRENPKEAKATKARWNAQNREQINARRRELYRLKKLAAIRERGLRESKAWLKTTTAKRLMSDEALRQYETKEAA